MRKLKGGWAIIVKVLSFALIAFQLYTTGRGPYSDIIQRGVHLSFVLTLLFLSLIHIEKEVDRQRRIRYTIIRSKAAADAEQLQLHIGELCNGSTYDSDSYCLGSNPSSPAIRLHGQAVKTLPSQGKIMGSIPIGGATKQNDCVLFFYLPEMRCV